MYLGLPNLGLNSYQAGGPALSLDFVSTEIPDGRLTISGGTGGTRVDSSGTIVSASAPRYDYNPSTRAALGLLVEEQRTNLKNNSAQFNLWSTNVSPNDTSVSSDAAVSPDGTVSADLIIPSALLGSKLRFQSFTGAINTTYTYSVFLKAGGYSWCYISLGNTGFPAGGQAYFNLTTGAIGTIGVSASNVQMVPYGNGWFRCIITVTSNGTGGAYIPNIGIATSDNTPAMTGDGVSGIYAWGAQVEAAVFSTSYIPTTIAAVTRTADSVTMTGANFTSWVNQTEGTLWAETQIIAYSTTANPNIVALYGTVAATDSIDVFLAGGGPNYRADITAGGVNTFLQNVVSVGNILDVNKFALAYQANNSVSYGRTTNVTDITVTLPTTTSLNLNVVSSGCSKYIRRLKFYSHRLSASELLSITS